MEDYKLKFQVFLIELGYQKIDEMLEMPVEALIIIAREANKRTSELKQDSLKLEALEGAGVDNWDGYSDAMESMEDVEDYL